MRYDIEIEEVAGRFDVIRHPDGEVLASEVERDEAETLATLFRELYEADGSEAEAIEASIVGVERRMRRRA